MLRICDETFTDIRALIIHRLIVTYGNLFSQQIETTVEIFIKVWTFLSDRFLSIDNQHHNCLDVS